MPIHAHFWAFWGFFSSKVGHTALIFGVPLEFISRSVRARLQISVLWCHHGWRKIGFSPNVTTLRSGLFCYRKSVCRLSVTLVHPSQGVEAFGNVSSPLCTLAIFWPPCKILRRSSQGNPSVGGVKGKTGSKIRAILDLSKAISHKRYKVGV